MKRRGKGILAALALGMLVGCAPTMNQIGTYPVSEGNLILTSDQDLIKKTCNRDHGCYVQETKTIVCSSSELDICGQYLFHHLALTRKAS